MSANASPTTGNVPRDAPNTGSRSVTSSKSPGITFLHGFSQISLFFKEGIYLFLERGEGREKERERNIDVREKHRLVASHTAPD